MTTNIFSLIIVIGVLVFFHELGHFLVARFFNVGVEKFSLGFGPKLFGKKIGMTEYLVSALPLGGYVKMVGEDPEAEIDEKDKEISFSHKPPLQRIAIVAAGPIFNFALAIVIFFLLFIIIGDEASRPIVGQIEPDSPALEAGLLTGDKIVSVNGKKVTVWEDIAPVLKNAEKSEAVFTVERGSQTLSITILPEKKTGKNVIGDIVEFLYIGADPYYEKVLIAQVSPGTPASRSGLQGGDQLVKISGKIISTMEDVHDVISGSNGKELLFDIIRGSKSLTLNITPEKIEVEGTHVFRVGIRMGTDLIRKRLGLIDSIVESFRRTGILTVFMARAVYKMIVQELPSSDLGGPILIAKMAGDQARAGIDKLISFIAFISINLAILNLLPVPVLDGGHLMFYTIEIITRRPLSTRAREIASMVGLSLLMLLMVYVFYNDIMRFVLTN